MTTTITALNSSSINFAEFVRLTLPAQTLTFCNASAPITVDGILFEGLSTLLQISEIQKNVKANSADLQISLTGIDPSTVAIVLGAQLKGSKIEIWRGFLDSNNQIITTPTQQFFRRYQGIVNNVAISETFNNDIRERVATCNITSASMRAVLDAKVAGIKTNQRSWTKFYPTDTSMNRVAVIVSTSFDFGKPPLGGGQAEPSVPETVVVEEVLVVDNNGG
jgi:hypothetical protein